MHLSLWTLLCFVFPSLVIAAPATKSAPYSPTPLRRNTSPYKGYSGYVLDKDSLRVAYYYDQTIVIVEVVGADRTLLNCEIIEVYEEDDLEDAVKTITKAVGEPFLIDMERMIKLMKQCQRLPVTQKSKFDVIGKKTAAQVKNVRDASQYTLLNGILPGTKWCGTGDIADTYYDLGSEVKLDKCCRTHDLCPTKIRAHTSRYNVTNSDFYSKSHCTCDKIFRNCLKDTKLPEADLMGEFYFNIFRAQCLEDGVKGKKFKWQPTY